jgi:hypothetical protein
MSDDVKVSNGLGSQWRRWLAWGVCPSMTKTSKSLRGCFVCGCDVGYAAAGCHGRWWQRIWEELAAISTTQLYLLN